MSCGERWLFVLMILIGPLLFKLSFHKDDKWDIILFVNWLIPRFCNRSNTTGATCELLTLPGHMSSPPGFSGVCVAQSLVFCVVFCPLYLAILLSLLLRFTVVDYHFVIFKLFFVNFYVATRHGNWLFLHIFLLIMSIALYYNAVEMKFFFYLIKPVHI